MFDDFPDRLQAWATETEIGKATFAQWRQRLCDAGRQGLPTPPPPPIVNPPLRLLACAKPMSLSRESPNSCRSSAERVVGRARRAHRLDRRNGRLSRCRPPILVRSLWWPSYRLNARATLIHSFSRGSPLAFFGSVQPNNLMRRPVPKRRWGCTSRRRGKRLTDWRGRSSRSSPKPGSCRCCYFER
jgi:hypothetical protein